MITRLGCFGPTNHLTHQLLTIVILYASYETYRIPARTKALLPPPMLEPFEIRLQNLQTSESRKRAKQPCDPSKNNYLHTQRDSRLATTSKKNLRQ